MLLCDLLSFLSLCAHGNIIDGFNQYVSFFFRVGPVARIKLSPVSFNNTSYSCDTPSRCFGTKERDSQLVADAISALGGTALKSSTFSREKPEGLSDR